MYKHTQWHHAHWHTHLHTHACVCGLTLQRRDEPTIGKLLGAWVGFFGELQVDAVANRPRGGNYGAAAITSMRGGASRN